MRSFGCIFEIHENIHCITHLKFIVSIKLWYHDRLQLFLFKQQSQQSATADPLNRVNSTIFQISPIKSRPLKNWKMNLKFVDFCSFKFLFWFFSFTVCTSSVFCFKNYTFLKFWISKFWQNTACLSLTDNCLKYFLLSLSQYEMN